MNSNMQSLLKIAERESEGDQVLLPTLIKEIIHYDLLHAVTKTPELARNLVFHGGTALRLCHASTRFSEDLDFCCGDDAAFEHLDQVAGEQFSRLMEGRYGLHTRWNQKKPLVFEGGGVEVRRWQARVYIPVPGSRTGQEHSHRINIEVSRMPSFDNRPSRIHCHYPHLAPAFRELLVRTASPEEILVDKILAITNREMIKSRDIWDIDMLVQAETEFKPELFAKRFSGPSAKDWESRLQARINLMKKPEQLRASAQELGRFVNKQERAMLLDHKTGHNFMLAERVATYLQRVHRDRGQVPMRGRRALISTPAMEEEQSFSLSMG